jgi:hypothetical protein
VRPAMLWAVGTSVGIGEDAQPEIISRIITASAECVRPELRPRRRITSKLILAQPLVGCSPTNMVLQPGCQSGRVQLRGARHVHSLRRDTPDPEMAVRLNTIEELLR